MNKEIYNNICSYFRNSVLPNTEFENHVYTVGGCNRDIIMGLEPHDIDICVDIINGGIAFAQYLYDNGYLIAEPAYFPAYGTSSFILKEFPDVTIEAVMTRKEQYKDSNSRNPETVFGTIEEDALRRDLTINSIYYNISQDLYIDPNNGQDDIKNKIIRTPQDPNVIFEDDPLRILRVVRFSLRFPDFFVNSDLRNMIIKKRSRLAILKQERITSEITKMMECTDLCNFANTINRYRLSEFLFPELTYEFYKIFGQYNIRHFIGKTENMSISYYWALIFSAAGRTFGTDTISKFDDYIFELCNNTLIRLKYSNKIINDTLKYLQIWNDCIKSFHVNNEYCFRKMQYYSKTKEQSDNVYNFFLNVFKLKENGLALMEFKNSYEDYIKNNLETTMGYNISLPITGNDIMTLFNLQPCSEIKQIMNIALDFLLRNPEYFNKENLILTLKEIYQPCRQ